MNNLSIIKYDIKRLLFTKKFFYMVLLLSVYTYDILTRILIDGFNGTEPFSKWSFSELCTFLASMSSVLLILFCITIFNEKEMAVRRIIYSAPISEGKYYLLKVVSIFTVYIIAVLVPFIISFIHYYHIFAYTAYLEFIEPVMIFFVPSIIFILGLSMMLGKINVKLLYGLIPLVILFGHLNLELPSLIDIYGNNYLNYYGWRFISEFSEATAIPYNIPSGFIFTRVMFMFLGIMLLLKICSKK